MIHQILSYYTQLLQDYLFPFFPKAEGCAAVGFIGNSSEPKPNKLVVSLLSLERDAMHRSSSSSNAENGSFHGRMPVLYMNMNVMFASIFEEKRYSESLSVLSSTLLFLQSHTVFSYLGVNYTVEVVSLSSQELNNVWSALGGQYYPSVVCKIRRLTFDAGVTRSAGHVFSDPQISK